MNKFINMGENLTHSQEGSLKIKHLNNEFVEQFSNTSRYRELRDFTEIQEDMEKLWKIDPVMACQFVLYLRMITRETKYQDNKYKCTGAGLKHESICRMYWIGMWHWDEFEKILPLFISVGSWKDLFQLWRMDITGNNMNAMTYKGTRLYWNKLLDLVEFGLDIDRDMVVKYLPAYVCRKRQTTALKKANSMIAKYIMQYMWPQSDKVCQNFHYRKLKNGNAYDWQVKISHQDYNNINFNTIAGRALMLLTNGEFLKKHGLEEKFANWILSKPMAKFTGYVYELFANYNSNFPKWKKELIDRQFNKLLADGKDNKSDLFVVMDTSGSMTGRVPGTKVTAYTIARALALYFSYSLKGDFKDTFAFFGSKCEMRRWNDGTPTEKWEGDYRETVWDSTNFQKVINLFITLKERCVPESDFPKGVLCISDGEFENHGISQTEFEYAISRMRQYFSKEYCDSFRIILWDIPNNFYTNVPEKRKFEGNGNFVYMAGYDANNVRFLFNEDPKSETQPKSTKEVFLKAMDQSILRMVPYILSKTI